MTGLIRLFPALLLAALAACGKSAVPSEESRRGGAEAETPIDSGVEPIAQAALTGIPERFRGRWNVSAGACAGAPGDGALEVAANRLRFHESEARVEPVRQVAPNAVEAQLAFAGEGQSWREVRTLRLLRGGRLTVEGPGGTATRIRCRPAGAAAPGGGWQNVAGGDGDALVFSAGGTRALTLLCPASADRLLVNVPAFEPVGSEGRMTIGSGGTAVALVADVTGDAERGGVSATGPVPGELRNILASGYGVAVNYGDQNSGPHPPPPPELAARFVESCRG